MMDYLAEYLLGQAQTGPHIQFVYDLTTRRVVFVSAAYEQILQGNCDRVNEELPALLQRLHPDELPVLTRLWRLFEKGALNEEVEIRLLRDNQPDQWFYLTPHWHQDSAGHTLLGGVLRDISLDKQHKDVLIKFSSKKNTVLEILSHDLAGAFALLQQLGEYVHGEMSPQTNPRVPEMLNLMLSTSQHSVQLIHDLVGQEFLESSDIPLKRERVDLRKKVQQCLKPFRRAPGSEQEQLLCELPDEPVYAEVDITKLLQVITNLVGNALKFTPDDGRIVVSVTPHSSAVRITVADEGIGIPEELQPHLFERFTPARRRGLRGEPTTGLGLSLCKTIVELHGGSITVVSAEGKGSTFTVEIPIR
jgi:two-component system sensor histidine kinase VicK